MAAKRKTFDSKLAVIVTMACSAIGLGNLWRFPYMVGENGGAAFIIIYLVATALISLPVFYCEVMMGRRSAKNSREAASTLAPGKKFWKHFGMLTIIVPCIVASYYSVIGGWSLQYFFYSFDLDNFSTNRTFLLYLFKAFTESPWKPIVFHLLYMGIGMVIVLGGLHKGVERFSKVALPLLFVLIIFVAIYALCLPGSEKGLKYLLSPDFSLLSPKSIAAAMGQSFFSLSLASGVLITFGSYVKKKDDIIKIGLGTAFFDIFFALLAGLAIMSAIFAAGIEPGSGPSLVFQGIPFIFAKVGGTMPVFSSISSILFFLAVLVAAMTSSVALYETLIEYLVEKHNIKRKRACLYTFLVCGGLGVLCSLSFGPLKNIKIAGKIIFDFCDWSISNIVMMIIALLTVVFVGFIMKKEDVKDEFTNSGTNQSALKIFDITYFLIRWVCPIAIFIIFITNFIA